MKKIIALMIVGLVTLSSTANAVVKCETDSRGRVCCWDTDRDGTFKPISCY